MTEEVYRHFSEKMLEYEEKVAFTYYIGNDVYHKTYGNLINDVERYCIDLKSNGIRNSRIVFWAPNCYTWIPLSIAMTALNNTLLFVDCSSVDMLQQVIERYNAAFIVTIQGADIAAALRSNDQIFSTVSFGEFTVSRISRQDYCDGADEIADYILFTSGSTGIPKGVLIDSKNMFCAAECIGNNLRQYKNTLLVLPLNHIYGYCAITLSHLYRGEEIIISHGIKYLNRELTRFEPSTVFMVPTLLYSCYDLNSKLGKSLRDVFGRNLKALYVGGGKLNASYVEKYRKLGIEVLNGYGMTEMCGCIAIMHEGMSIVDSVGKPYPEVQIKIVNGEIWINSPYHMSGYYDGKTIQQSIQDGWYRTGDAGFIENGCLYIKERTDQIIALPNGKNIFSPDLENLIRNIRGVTGVAIYISQDRLSATIDIDKKTKAESVLEAMKDINHSLPSYMRIIDVKVERSSQ